MGRNRHSQHMGVVVQLMGIWPQCATRKCLKSRELVVMDMGIQGIEVFEFGAATRFGGYRRRRRRVRS